MPDSILSQVLIYSENELFQDDNGKELHLIINKNRST